MELYLELFNAIDMVNRIATHLSRLAFDYFISEKTSKMILIEQKDMR
jgi:hypothetical protein